GRTRPAGALSFHPSRPPSRTRPTSAMPLISIAESAQNVSCRRPHLGNAGRDLGSTPAIPTRKNEAPVACRAWIYANRERVERLWSRLEEGRGVGMAAVTN